MAHRDYVTFYLFILFLFNLIVKFNALGLKTDCVQESSCLCMYPNGMGIDLRPILLEQPSFLTVSNTSVVYYYHPCADFPIKSLNTTECTSGATLCLYHANQTHNTSIDANLALSNYTDGQFSLLAAATEAVFKNTIFAEGTPQLVFKHNDITTTILLQCSEELVKSTLQIQPTSDSKTHNLILTSTSACVRYPTLAADSGASGSTVFVILFFVIFGTYFLTGFLIMKFIVGATGAELIPNYSFWNNLMLLVRDGCRFALSCGQVLPEGYESI